MRKPRGVPNHSVAPAAWRSTSNLTGDYELDASILNCKNRAVPGKLEMYVSKSDSYGPRGAYNGYSGMSGDD